MAELILHHFDLSPFAEKARLMLGLKGLAWRSVEIPLVMPKPDLTALTGGYRKTPVLQVGADVYCDTKLIAVELERRCPTPTLFPGGHRGLALALSAWSDRAFFDPGAGLSMGLNKRGLPDAILKDRKAFFNFMDFDVLEAEIPHLTTQLRAQADLVEQQLADGRAFLLGDAPGLADVNAYFPVWMARGNVPTAGEIFAPYARLAHWESRMRALGHGTRREMTAAEAHAIARASEPEPGQGVDPADALGLAVGDAVVVTPDDYGKVPVHGELLTLQLHEVAVRRTDPKCGTVVVHFPRIGYRVERAA
ncbi:MAG: glutathione S-transferase family protein [Steroidobacteraceae bacterium]|nr:glutathione S-transferase family protein [Steroidobacteraceae bacterium]